MSHLRTVHSLPQPGRIQGCHSGHVTLGRWLLLSERLRARRPSPQRWEVEAIPLKVLAKHISHKYKKAKFVCFALN